VNAALAAQALAANIMPANRLKMLFIMFSF
jgi:hypothetical protein